MLWWDILISLIPITFFLSMAFSLMQICFIYLIILVLSLYLKCTFVEFVNKYIVLIASFINKRIIDEINKIIISFHKAPFPVGKVFKAIIKLIDKKPIICLDEPFGYNLFGFKTNKQCANLLLKHQQYELKMKMEEYNYKQSKKSKQSKQGKQKNKNLFRNVMIYVLVFIVIVCIAILFYVDKGRYISMA